MSFQVSVIIPVYNAEKYLRQAVESAVSLAQVGEVILVEDKSPDGALALCEQLVHEFPKVKLYRHPNGENRGAGASRNLGIEQAKFDHIAFLDADDYFLPNRFSATQKTFENTPLTDGVYEAIGYFKEGNEETFKLFTVSKALDPNRLFHYLLRGTYGHFSTIGVTIKKSLFERAGFFNTTLKLHQDAELWLRLAYYGKLCAGDIDSPVSMARKHSDNRITHANPESKILYWSTVKTFFSDKKVGLINWLLIIRKIAKLKASKSKKSYFLQFISELLKK